MKRYHGSRPYSPSEIRADAVVHVLGLSAGVIAAAILLTRVVLTGGAWVPLMVYVLGLLAMLSFSATYNLWPATPVKWILRRFDHSAIYLLIAGTYTALLPFLTSRTEAVVLGLVIWSVAALGIVLKVALPGRFDKLAIAVYLGMGWAGVFSIRSFMAVLPMTTQILIAVGGLLYTVGVIFYVWERLKFQNAIWHAFVATAAGCQFAGIAYLYS
ncbi:MAG TPA: hemolysin III family protein [Aestuariivirga sp.]|nr:hemolysin III family protein [Aestuariivirga sp.]